ncbi:hypothetical protein E3E12_02285 [Formicincola oecophyllae]|uniref:Uncharacterized protein n=1 Tax=Formicincola oecophyllae TaxID=2558361 RepID=A0A4Y6U768_9PROT|nr:hypothetical protein [Formicincola oecophyllae]QDH13219.1 hypothetical protein E3E12_02285 [Formicincola oecophyllae]
MAILVDVTEVWVVEVFMAGTCELQSRWLVSARFVDNGSGEGEAEVRAVAAVLRQVYLASQQGAGSSLPDTLEVTSMKPMVYGVVQGRAAIPKEDFWNALTKDRPDCMQVYP